MKQKNKKENIEKNVERGIRAELKRRKLHDGENKIVEVIEKAGNILKVKKTKVIKENNTGKVKRLSQTQTLVNITTRRPYKNNDKDGKENVSETMRLKAKKLVEITNEITENPEEAGKVHAKAVDMLDGNSDFSVEFKKQSKAFKEKNKLTLEEAGTLHLATNQSRRSYRKALTALN